MNSVLKHYNTGALIILAPKLVPLGLTKRPLKLTQRRRAQTLHPMIHAYPSFKKRSSETTHMLNLTRVIFEGLVVHTVLLGLLCEPCTKYGGGQSTETHPDANRGSSKVLSSSPFVISSPLQLVQHYPTFVNTLVLG